MEGETGENTGKTIRRQLVTTLYEYCTKYSSLLGREIPTSPVPKNELLLSRLIRYGTTGTAPHALVSGNKVSENAGSRYTTGQTAKEKEKKNPVSSSDNSFINSFHFPYGISAFSDNFMPDIGIILKRYRANVLVQYSHCTVLVYSTLCSTVLCGSALLYRMPD
ncbi:hypothetical protein HOY82DRAFT_108381 [Tuber indicum]|nr:hypothetical protein HOY82DRAFT_108381 [Tuber indicum]